MGDAEEIARRRKREREEFLRQRREKAERDQQERDMAADSQFEREAADLFGGLGWQSDLGSYAADAADREAIHQAKRAADAARRNPRNRHKQRKSIKATKRARPAINRAKANKKKKSGWGCAVAAIVIMGAPITAAAWGVVDVVSHLT